MISQLEIINIHSSSLTADLLNLHAECKNIENSFHKSNRILYSLLLKIKNEGIQIPSISL